jgi:hypothetical protein
MFSRSYERTYVPQSWKTFQRLRQHNKTNITGSGEENVRSKFANQPTPSSNGKNEFSRLGLWGKKCIIAFV